MVIKSMTSVLEVLMLRLLLIPVAVLMMGACPCTIPILHG